MARDLMSDEEWAFHERFILATRAPNGRKLLSHRLVLDGIFWIARTGSPWRDLLPARMPWCGAAAAMAAGGGFNAMVAARRAGLAAALAGTLGTGPLADVCAAGLASAGIVPLRPRLAGMDQGCCAVLVDAGGERTFIASEGADGQVLDADLAGLALEAGTGC